MTGESMSQGLIAALDVILDNDEYISLLVDIGNSVTTNMGWNSTTIRRDDLIDEINDLKVELATMPNDGYSVIDLYVSRSREFRGINFRFTENDDFLGEVGFVYNPDIGFEFSFVEQFGNLETFRRIHGDLISGNDGKSGNVYFSFEDEMGSFTLRILDFENLRTSRSNGINSLEFKLIFDLDRLIRDLRANDLINSGDDLDILVGSTVTLEVTSQGNADQVILVFSNNDIDLSLLVSTEFLSQLSIEPPGDGYDVFDDIWDVDFEKLESNLLDLINEIDRAGIDVRWFDALLEGVF